MLQSVSESLNCHESESLLLLAVCEDLVHFLRAHLVLPDVAIAVWY